MSDLRDEQSAKYLRAAYAEALKSVDPSTQNGAVLVHPTAGIIGRGHNRFATGVVTTPERLADRAQKYPRTAHAEENAFGMRPGSDTGRCSLLHSLCGLVLLREVCGGDPREWRPACRRASGASRRAEPPLEVGHSGGYRAGDAQRRRRQVRVLHRRGEGVGMPTTLVGLQVVDALTRKKGAEISAPFLF